MIDEVNRTEGDLQTTEDELQTMEDDRGMIFIFIFHDFHLQTNKASLDSFEYSEMMGNYKGKMIKEVNWTEGHLP